MKKAADILLALGLIASCAQPVDGTGPLSADRLVCDFGVVPDSTTVLENTFLFTNTGRDSLRILRVQSSCGCTTTRLSSYTLGPGERAELHAVLSLGHFFDHIDKTISVSATGQKDPVVLHLVADKERDLADPSRYPYAPDGPARFSLQLFFAGYVAQGDLQEVSMLVYNGSDQPLTLRRKSRLPRHVRLQLPGTVEPGSIGRLTVTFDMRRASRLFGEYSHELLLTDGQGHRLPLKLYCVVTENFREQHAPFPRMVVPCFQMRILESELDGGPVQKSFCVQNTGEAPLYVRRIQLSEKGVQARMEPEVIPPGEEGRLVVTLRPESLDKAVECSITVNDPKHPFAIFTVMP